MNFNYYNLRWPLVTFHVSFFYCILHTLLLHFTYSNLRQFYYIFRQLLHFTSKSYCILRQYYISRNYCNLRQYNHICCQMDFVSLSSIISLPNAFYSQIEVFNKTALNKSWFNKLLTYYLKIIQKVKLHTKYRVFSSFVQTT